MISKLLWMNTLPKSRDCPARWALTQKWELFFVILTTHNIQKITQKMYLSIVKFALYVEHYKITALSTKMKCRCSPNGKENKIQTAEKFNLQITTWVRFYGKKYFFVCCFTFKFIYFVKLCFIYFFWRWIKKSWKNGWRQKKILLCLKCKSIISSRLSFFSLICEKYLHYDLTMKSHSMCKFVEVRWCYCNYLKVKLYLD